MSVTLIKLGLITYFAVRDVSGMGSFQSLSIVCSGFFTLALLIPSLLFCEGLFLFKFMFVTFHLVCTMQPFNCTFM